MSKEYLEAIKCLEKIDNTLCLNNDKGKLEFGIDTEEHIDCDSVIGMVEDLETIKQALLKAHKQEKFFDKMLIFKNNCITSCFGYKGKQIVAMPLKEYDGFMKQEKVLELIKEKKVDIELLKESHDRYEYNTHFPYREIYQLTQEEFSLLKEVLE